jgi:DNA modification methylase
VKVHCAHDKLVPIAELKPHPKNRNKHPKDQIARLAQVLEYQGFRYPVKVSLLSGYVTSGHGRIEAAKKNGWKEVPVDFQEYSSEEQEYADVQADNAIASWAELDLAGINDDLKDLGPDFDIDLLGIKDFVIEVADKLPHGDPDETPPPPVEPKSKPGDLYELGQHRLLCGDSTNGDDVQKLMGGARADMVWTDPPYNVAYKGKTKDALTIENDSMGDADFYQFLYDVYVNMLTVTEPGGAIYVAHADSEGANFRKAMVDAGWLLKQCLVWVKQTLVMGRQDYHWKHEPILYGWAPGASHNWYADRKQTTVLSFDRPSRNAEHPTMKPVALVEYMIGNSSKKGDRVLDLFGGSGTTLIAAAQTGRRGYLMELDPKYVDVIVSRYVKYSGNPTVIRNGEEIAWGSDA